MTETTPTYGPHTEHCDLIGRMLHLYTNPFLDGQEADAILLEAVREIKRLRQELAWARDVIRDAASDLEDAVSRDAAEG